MPSLNIDVLCQILENTSVSELRKTAGALIPCISDDDIKRCEHARLNPITYMAQLTKYSKDLLMVMGALGVVLSGSRAANYFYPGLCNNDSDWDFYCDGDLDSVVRFSTYMERIGVEWEWLSGHDRDQEREYDHCELLRGILCKDGKVHVVQLVWTTYGCKNAVSLILNFHSSVVQCFLTGFCAVSMYESLTSVGKSLAWCNPNSEGTSARHKYANRGVKYISYDWYMGIVDDVGNINLDIVGPNSRSLMDSDAKFISFSRYFSYLDDIDPLKELLQRVVWCDNSYTCEPKEDVEMPRTGVNLEKVGVSGKVIEERRRREWRDLCEWYNLHEGTPTYIEEVKFREIAEPHMKLIMPWFSDSAVAPSILNDLHLRHVRQGCVRVARPASR